MNFSYLALGYPQLEENNSSMPIYYPVFDFREKYLTFPQVYYQMPGVTLNMMPPQVPQASTIKD